MSKRKTTEQFINDAVARHGRRYDYSNAVYLGWDKQVEIICKVHGSFWQIASQHTLGSNCPVCVSENRRINIERLNSLDLSIYKIISPSVRSVNDIITMSCPHHGNFEVSVSGVLQGRRCQKCSDKTVSRDEFLKRAQSKFGNRFVYDLRDYQNATSTVTIICKEHGSVDIQAQKHLSLKRGCPLCSKTKYRPSYTVDDFIKKSELHYGKAYDYSDIFYNGQQSPITIRCRIHGVFHVRKAKFHSNGAAGCKVCKKQALLQRKQTEFIEKANTIHGEKYSYDLVTFAGAKIHITLICPIHGTFIQSPQEHLNGSGCPKCIGRMDTDEFITKANHIHNNGYEYTKTVFTNVNKDVTITCRLHGDFVTLAGTHLKGTGCPNCSRNSTKERAWLVSLGKDLVYGHRITLTDGTVVFPDGFDPVTNTVYEFHGDYWHGNPQVYPMDHYSNKHQMTFGRLYERTVERTQKIRDNGYNVIEMWEYDWDKLIDRKDIK